jgi:molybdopterin converting factor small subunit
LREAAESKEVELPVPAPTKLDAVLHAAAQRKPKLEPELWDEQGNLRDMIKVLVNGRQCEYLPDKLDTLVTDKDELDVFPPVGGG